MASYLGPDGGPAAKRPPIGLATLRSILAQQAHLAPIRPTTPNMASLHAIAPGAAQNLQHPFQGAISSFAQAHPGLANIDPGFSPHVGQIDPSILSRLQALAGAFSGMPGRGGPAMGPAQAFNPEATPLYHPAPMPESPFMGGQYVPQPYGGQRPRIADTFQPYGR